ncbi:hypothetical protein JW960_29250 [candidate division KSB1 bacterium]|nr:hypothetical protein [candidate division KSB1 bacterium]
MKFHNVFSLVEFDELKAAVIDASSIIYLSKLRMADELTNYISLYTTSQIVVEANLPLAGMEIVVVTENNFSNDENLIKFANEKQLPIISDDRKVLLTAQKLNLRYYNSLMMLLFLVYKRVIQLETFNVLEKKLSAIAYYSDDVIKFGKKVLHEIMNQLTL